MAGKHVFVVGAANSAGQAALHLAKYALRVTMLVRGASLAEKMSAYLVDEIHATDLIDVRHHTEIVNGAGDRRLESLTTRDSVTGTTETLEAGALFVLIGATPHTEWLPDSVARDERGFILTGRDALTAATRTAGRWTARRCPWKPACQGCSPSATCGTGPRKGLPPPWARARRHPTRA